MRYFLIRVLYIEEKEVIYEYILIEVIMTKIKRQPIIGCLISLIMLSYLNIKVFCPYFYIMSFII